MSLKNGYLYDEKDVARVAESIYLMRMKKGEYWGTADGDFKYAEELCKRWWNGKTNT